MSRYIKREGNNVTIYFHSRKSGNGFKEKVKTIGNGHTKYKDGCEWSENSICS